MIPSAYFRLRRGLTLIEVLIAAGIVVAALAVIVVLVNPLARLKENRDHNRQEDVVDLLEALEEYKLQTGAYPAAIDDVYDHFQVLGTERVGCDAGCGTINTVTACLNLATDLASTALRGIPIDPENGTAQQSGYAVNMAENGRLTVLACGPESTEQISATK